jgi:hypothetical protein
MRTETLAMYENEQKYQNEFKSNLEQCQNEFNTFFNQTSEGAVSGTVSVCAPGILIFSFCNLIISV